MGKSSNTNLDNFGMPKKVQTFVFDDPAHSTKHWLNSVSSCTWAVMLLTLFLLLYESKYQPLDVILSNRAPMHCNDGRGSAFPVLLARVQQKDRLAVKVQAWVQKSTKRAAGHHQPARQHQPKAVLSTLLALYYTRNQMFQNSSHLCRNIMTYSILFLKSQSNMLIWM